MHRRPTRTPSPAPVRLRHPGDEVSIAVEDDLDEAARLRAMIRGLLPDALPARTREDVLLVASELVTNALLHGEAPRRLHLVLLDDGVRIEVEDGSVLPAEPVDPSGRVGGLGLHIVRRLCVRWGSWPLPHGKRVWGDVVTCQRR